MRRLSLAFCGCGSRARTYAGIAAGMGDQFTLVAAADPVPERVAAIRQHAGNPAGFRSYASAEAMFAEGKPADVVVIATQDAQHREHALRAMELGCDLLLEKPIAHRREDTLAVSEAAGVPTNGDVHVVERLHLTTPDTMVDDIEVTAPRVLTAPWKTTREYFRQRSRQYEITESVCLQGHFTEAIDAHGDAVFVPTPQTSGGTPQLQSK